MPVRMSLTPFFCPFCLFCLAAVPLCRLITMCLALTDDGPKWYVSCAFLGVLRVC
jgi:hypothetical protein